MVSKKSRRAAMAVKAPPTPPAPIRRILMRSPPSLRWLRGSFEARCARTSVRASLALLAPQPPSLTLALVEGLGRLLVGAPPVLVPAIPVDGVGQPRLEVLEVRRPVQLGAELAGLDR